VGRCNLGAGAGIGVGIGEGVMGIDVDVADVVGADVVGLEHVVDGMTLKELAPDGVYVAVVGDVGKDVVDVIEVDDDVEDVDEAVGKYVDIEMGDLEYYGDFDPPQRDSGAGGHCVHWYNAGGHCGRPGRPPCGLFVCGHV
jgi:hypothetical protein